MSTALATLPIPTSEMAAWNNDRLDLLKRTICKGASNDEFDLFVQVCKRTGLDPFVRQIYAVKRWDRKANREVMTVQTGIDGYRTVAERTGCYAGSDDPVYDTEDAAHPNKATVTVYKIVGGQRVPFSASARWKEYVQMGKEGPSKFWAQMPYLMLGKVAEALALRKAFPNDLSGVYTAEEMAQADNDGGAVMPITEAKPSLKDKLKVKSAGLVAAVEGIGGVVVEPKISDEDLAVLVSRYHDAARERQWSSVAADLVYDKAFSSKAFKAAYDNDPREAMERLIANVGDGKYDQIAASAAKE